MNSELPRPEGIEPYAEGHGWAIYCADALSVLPRLPDASVHMVLTDPPYGHNNNNNGDLIARRETALGRGAAGAARPIANDGPEAEPLFRAMLDHSARLLAASGCCCCCCCGGGGPDPMFARWALAMDAVLRFKQAVVWDKGRMGMGWHYRRSYEFVLVAEKRGQGPSKWYDTSRKVENIIRAKGCPGSPEIRKIIPRADQHPTEKPVELGEWFLRLHTEPGDIVLDPLMGSGAFGAAAVGLRRRFIGADIDPHWCQVAAERLRAAEAEA